MASCGVGPPRDRWCLDFDELDELELELDELELELPLNSFEILLIFPQLFSELTAKVRT